jgi:hypothetical protein
LLDSFEANEEAVSEALTEVTTERDGLLTEVIALREQVAASAPLQEKIDTMIVGQAEWKKEQHALLVSESQQYAWRAERAESAAKEKLESAQRQFSETGLEALIEEMRKLVAQHNIPQPDIWNLSKGTNPFLLTLWGWDILKAKYFVALTQGYREPTEAFRQLLLRHLKAGLPIHGTVPDPIEHLGIKLEVMRMMASRWPGVMEQAQRQVDEIEAQERAQAMLNNNMRLAEQQTELARRGYGREPIGQPEPQADPHFWNGFIPANPEWKGSEAVRPLEDDGPSEPFEDR